MDNASKALIMAGAILIAVALVGVGVYMFQSASGTVNQGDEIIDASRIETINAGIEQFEGKIRGSELKTLIRRVNSYNENDIFPEPLELTGNGVKESTTKAGFYEQDSIIDSKDYTVELEYSNAWVKKIKVT